MSVCRCVCVRVSGVTMCPHTYQNAGLERFKNVVLLSSAQDRYVPYHSARIEVPPAAAKDSTYGSVYIEMVQNIFRTIDKVNFVRFDVFFGIPKSNLDTFIGRAAHVLFLDSSTFAQMFTLTYRKFLA